MIAVLEIGRQSNHLQASDYGTVIVPSGWIATSLKKRRSLRGSTVARTFIKSNHHLLDRAKHSRETLNAGCIMSVEIPTVTPYQAQLRQAHQQRQIKMAAAARRAKIARTQPEVSSRPPLWRTSHITFDAHIRAYQFHLANRMVRPEVAYLKRRCAEMGVPYREIIGRSVLRSIVEARRILMWEVREKFDLSFADVGRAFGGREQTTAISAIKALEASRMRKQ